MATRKQLISESLTTLGTAIIGQQCELKQLQRRKLHLIDVLISMDEQEESLRHSLKSLKDKAEWEIRENKALIEAETARRAGKGRPQSDQNPSNSTPLPPPLPGDEWRNAD